MKANLTERAVSTCWGFAYSDTLTFELEGGEFVQILNCARNHWVCVATIGCKPGVVKVYDSMRTGGVPTTTKEAIVMSLIRCGRQTQEQ